MKKIGVIFGGRSGEHEISLMSASSVIESLDSKKFDVLMLGITKKGKWLRYKGPVSGLCSGLWEKKGKPLDLGRLKEHIDFALPILHGPYGEDGTIQGLLEMLDIPYGGCGVLASAACMDKAVTKELLRQAGLPTCKYRLVRVHKKEDFDAEKESFNAEEAEKELGYPMFVKPANAGSSIGISKVWDRKGLAQGITEAARYDRRILLEEAISGREIETGVLGNHILKTSAVGEVLPSNEFYDYKAKYFDGGRSRITIPADIPEDIAKNIRRTAEQAYKALDCEGFARIDFFLEKDTDKLYINEINTIPGFTDYSMIPRLFAAEGVPYTELVERIVELGYERYNAENSR